MKRYLRLFIFFIVSFTIFSAPNETIKSIDLSSFSKKLTFKLNTASKPKYNSSYDEYNRMLFIEIENVKMGTKFKESKYTGKYIESMSMMDYGKNVGFFIKLKKGVGHKVSLLKNPYRVVVDLKNGDSNKKEFTVAIDAGHGGKDPGAIGLYGYREKDITLAVAKKLQKELSKDFNIVMIRNTDTFVTLKNRSRIANNAKADLFVSLHINSSREHVSNGIEVFYFSKKSSPYAEKIAAYENSFGEKYGEKTNSIAQIMGELSYNKNMEKSIKLARPINSSLARSTNMKGRGIYGANFAVLRGFNGPGLLIELGFISNKDNVSRMVRSSYQDVMAKQIAAQIREYFN